MTGARHRPPLGGWRVALVRWRKSRRLYVVLWVFIAVLVPSSVVGAAVDEAPDGRRASASLLPTVEESEPTARASGIRPRPTPATSTPIIPSSSADPEAADDPRPSEATRACRCEPRSPVAAPTTAAASPTTAASSPTSAPPTDPQPSAVSGLLELVNADRRANGCGPVTLHPDLIGQSQAQANAQASDDAMYHSGGVAGFGTWAENVAFGRDTAAAAHDGWMGSTRHRKNILNCAYVFMGAGAADSGTGVRYWTEQFAA